MCVSCATASISTDILTCSCVAEASCARQPLVELATRNVYRNISMLAIARNLDIPWYRMPLVFLNGRKEMARALATVQPVGGMLSVIKKLHSDGYTLFIVSTNSTPSFPTLSITPAMSYCYCCVC